MEIILSIIAVFFLLVVPVWFFVKLAIYIIKMFKGLGSPPTHNPLDDGVDENYPWHEGPP